MKTLWLLLFTFPSVLSAQMVVTSQVDLPVYRENQSEIRNPWTGGINSAQISLFDADNDGEQDDIFLFDKAGDRLLIFTGDNIEGERVYNYRPELAAGFPDLKSWALLRDFNCDGKKDIFTYSPIGGACAVYRNTGNGNELSFEMESVAIQSEFEFTTFHDTTNIYVSSQDIPAVFDFEGDGDLDIMTFGVSGALLELHLNYSVENNGSCGIESFMLKNRCYGRFVEGGQNNGIITDPEIVDQQCNFNVIDPRGNNHNTGPGGNRHIGSTVLAFDANADDLPDIVLGDVSYTNMTYLENSDRGDVLVDSVVYVNPAFPIDFNAPAVHLEDFPSGFYEDIDGDAIRDLIVSVNKPNVGKNHESVWYYKNNGADNLPDFELIQQDFLQDETLDYGEGSVPALFDYNGDGLKDLVIGSRGYYLGSANYEPVLALYINTGTATNPEFTLEDSDWLDVSGTGLGQYVYPAFGDIDGDGDQDMLLGDGSGGVFLFTNSAGEGNPADLSLTGALSADGENIDVGQSSTPQLFDLNGDDVLDLIVGERNGNLNYFENTGTSTGANFTLVTDTLGGVSSIAPNYFTGSSSPWFYRFDNITYLVMGSESGTIFQYDNIDDNLNGDFDLMSMEAFSIDVGNQSKPYVYDLNTDGLPDVLCGSVGGGVNLFMGDFLVGLSSVASAKNRLSIYPNPATTQINFELPTTFKPGTSNYSIYAVDGKCVASGSINSNRLSVDGFPKGLYLLKINTGNSVLTGKFVKK